ncbi:MAG: hypothetical protein JSW66_05655, partial [Phycisphaerales bacterium]
MCPSFQPTKVSKNYRWVCCISLFLPGVVSVSAITSDNQGNTNQDDTAILDVGSRRQVFIDGRFLDRSANIDLIVHPPHKTYEHTITPEHPWEPSLGSHISVLKMQDTYHLWYTTGGALCYARSQ